MVTRKGEAACARHCVANPSKNPGKASIATARDKGEEEGSSQFFVELDEVPSSHNHMKMSASLSNFRHHDLKKHGSNNEQPHSQWHTRSNETSPTARRRGKHSDTNKLNLDDSNYSTVKCLTSPAGVMRSPELSGKHGRRILNKNRDRSKSAAVPSAVANQKSLWVSRFRPGIPVPVPGETARESIMQSELRHREKEFCSELQIR